MKSAKYLLKTDNSSLFIIENYSIDYYNELKNIYLYEEPPIIVYGKQCRQRRNVGFYSNDSIGYKYSGQLMKSLPLDKNNILCTIMNQVNKDLNTNFNGILINSYKNGTKYVSPHSDDESGLDKKQKMIASLCYGPGIRTFKVTYKQNKKVALNYKHIPGTLLVMQGISKKNLNMKSL
jgi:alkylated DNA repair dioxygenase AlkB